MPTVAEWGPRRPWLGLDEPVVSLSIEYESVAEVAELADAPGSGPGSRLGSGGSSPLFGTLKARVYVITYILAFLFCGLVSASRAAKGRASHACHSSARADIIAASSLCARACYGILR